MSVIFCEEGAVNLAVQPDLVARYAGSSNPGIQRHLTPAQSTRFERGHSILAKAQNTARYFDIRVDNVDPIWVGFAVRITGAFDGGGGNNYQDIVGFLDGTTEQASLTIDEGGRLHIRQGGNIRASSTVCVPFGCFLFIEVKLTVHNTTGAATVKVNGETYITASSIDTQASANSYVNRVYFGDNLTSSFHNFYLNDIYILNDTSDGTPANNDFLGDCRQYSVLPTGDGNYTAWTPNSGTNHYDRVDEDPIDEDTTYVSTSTVGNKDTYTFPSIPTLPSSSTIHVVWVGAANRSDDATSTRKIKVLARHSSTDGTVDPAKLTGGLDQGLPTAGSYQNGGREGGFKNNPSTGSAWTESEVNAAEFGIEMKA